MKEKILNLVEDLESKKLQIKNQEQDIVDIFNKLSISEKSKLNSDGNTLLHEVIYIGNGFGANLLIPHTPDSILEQVDVDGFTCLHIAVAVNSYDIAKLLIKRMSQEAIDKPDSTGKTALHIATITNSTKITGLLLKKMSQEAIGRSDHLGKTALHHAAINNTQEVVRKIFLSSRMTQEAVDKADDSGKTALMYAIGQKHFALATIIARKMSVLGLNITLMNSDNEIEVQNLLQQFSETSRITLEEIDSYHYKSKLLVILAWKDFASSYHQKDSRSITEVEIKMKLINAVKLLNEHTLSIDIPNQEHDNSLVLREIISRHFAKIKKNILTYKADRFSSNTSEIDDDCEKLIYYCKELCAFLEKNLLLAHQNSEFVKDFKMHLDAMTNTESKFFILHKDFKQLLYAISSPSLYNISTVASLLESVSVALNTSNLLKNIETKWGVCEKTPEGGVLTTDEYLEENEVLKMIRNIDLSKLPKKHAIAVSIEKKVQYFLKIFHIKLEPQCYKDVEECLVSENNYLSNIIEENNLAQVIGEDGSAHDYT